MYSDFPPADRARMKAQYAITWLVVGAVGVVSAIAPGESVDQTLGRIIFEIAGLVLAIASAVGAFGVITNRYRVEWVAASVAIIGTIPYVAASWWILVDDHIGPVRTVAGTLLFLYPLSRYVVCLGHSNRQRAKREADQRIRDADLQAIAQILGKGAKGQENEAHG